MIKKKCKECGTLIDPYSQEYCEICHGNYGWWYTCDKHQDLIFRDEVKECRVCRAEENTKKNVKQKKENELNSFKKHDVKYSEKPIWVDKAIGRLFSSLYL